MGTVLKNTRDTSRTRTRRLCSWDKKYLWHPFTQMRDWLAGDPLIIDRAQGCYLIDTEGRRYLDGVSSLWVNVHGHRQALIDRALKEQIDKLSHSTMLGLSNVPAIELAKKLIAVAPKGLSRVFYSDNGSSSVEVALKMAYQYWQNLGKTKKTRIAHLANAYHGDTLGSVSVGGIDLFHHVYRKLIFKTVTVPFPDCYRAPRGKKYPDYAWEHVEKFERFLKKNHATVSALVVEPLVQGAAGMIVWPEGVLGKMAELCRRYDVLLIADEVATGFGRTGKMFACEHEGVRPDILCLAKGITGGYLPLAATLTTEKIFQGFLFDYKEQKTFFHGHTYTGNPLGCAAALANLEVFERERTLEDLAPKIHFLRERLPAFYQLTHVGDVRQKGLMVGIELVRDRASKEPYLWEERIGVRVCQDVRMRGVILRPLGNVIVLMPPLAISRAELEMLLEATYGAIEKVTAGA
ncbi:MAG: adenosylmethionine--8-amino-7-oxononanoate transaminase [Omnitrophica WOR_2 bacterium GWA2_45_18]|nr:MAG: adenosylmethionine--8-amino-7-oxononanoate transaminase [Omnitrophica WOR_2 bacterium GWA2_45_18]